MSHIHSRGPACWQTEEGSEQVSLLFKECPSCSTLEFPPGRPGCAICGHPLDDVTAVPRLGRGTLLESVTVHVPLGEAMPAPLVVGDLEIAPGVIRQAVLGVDSESGLELGQTMHAVIEPQSGRCVFVPEKRELA